jgi:hypothetical protein
MANRPMKRQVPAGTADRSRKGDLLTETKSSVGGVYSSPPVAERHSGIASGTDRGGAASALKEDREVRR